MFYNNRKVDYLNKNLDKKLALMELFLINMAKLDRRVARRSQG
jgi:hypothetical protein